VPAPSTTRLGSLLLICLGFLFLNLGTMVMLRMVYEYSSFDDQVGFLQLKQDYLHVKIWKTAFYVHVFFSVLTLLAGFTQFSAVFLQRYRPLHRILGRVYAANVLFINVPAGLVMAIYANGGLLGKAAFLILDLLWFWFTLKAILDARNGDFAGHRDFMIRSYALTLSALTLRTWNLILSYGTDLPEETVYLMNAWLGFVPNLLVAEWLIARRRRKS